MSFYEKTISIPDLDQFKKNPSKTELSVPTNLLSLLQELEGRVSSKIISETFSIGV